MSMRPRALPEVPEQTAAVAKAAFRKGTLAMRVRDELGEVFADGAFIDAFGIRGKPGISPGQLAMVTVLQFAENLTDRQAADAVRGRIDWKYCLGLTLADPGFDFSVVPAEMSSGQVRRHACIRGGGRRGGHVDGCSAGRADPGW
jgi:transposase